MNGGELKALVKDNGAIFVLERRSYGYDAFEDSYFVLFVDLKDGIVQERTLLVKEAVEWMETDSNEFIPLCDENHVIYEPINIEKFIEEHFAELL